MIQELILLLLTVAFTAFVGMLHGYKKGYGDGKRAGYFRAHSEKVSQ
jgi:hypothetical protein